MSRSRPSSPKGSPAARFEQYYALLPEKQPDVILYDDAEVRDMAEFHAWIEQHFTITDRYTVQHGTASLQVLVVG